MKPDKNFLADSTGCKIEIFDEIDSTNSYAKRNGLPVNTVIIAESQTAGRGRIGHSFFSPKNGLYLSIVTEYSEMLTVAAAVAVADVIEKYSKKSAKIKWVNDIFINSKKVCGILCEGISDKSGAISKCVVGIGINLCPPDGGFDESISNIAGSVFDNRNFDLTAFTADLINGFFKATDCDNIVKRYKSRMLYIGEAVYYEKNGVMRSGIVKGVDNRCGLIVQTEKCVETLICCEVSIRPFN